MLASGSRPADQGDVWQDIDAKSCRLMAESPTSAAAAMYEGSGSKLDEFMEQFEAAPRQAGALFTINGIVAGIDVFDCQATWRKSMRKLIQSYGLDAVDRAEEPASDAKPQPKRFLSTLKKAAREGFPAIGLGEDVRINGDTIVGGGLVVDGKVIHLVAFPGSANRGRGREHHSA